MVKTIDVHNSFKEPGRFERSLFSQFLPNIISCRLPEASSLGLLSMAEHYQIRIEASRYFEEDRGGVVILRIMSEKEAGRFIKRF